MIEIHSHVLPGIDDGAKDVQEAAGLLSLLKEQGVSSVVMTPHFYPDRHKLEEFQEKRDNAYFTLFQSLGEPWEKGRAFDMDLILASETLISDTLFAYDSLEALCISGTNYLLLELPYSKEWSGSVFRLIDKLMARYGVTPIIAHIERYDAIRHKPEKNLVELLDLGCLLQMNIDSLIERGSRRLAMKLVKKGYIDVVGSDCHSLISRPPRYREFYTVMEKNRLQGWLNEWQAKAIQIINMKNV